MDLDGPIILKGAPRLKLTKCLAIFKSTLKQVANLCLQDVDQLLFRPCQGPGCEKVRFKKLGYTTFTSCIMCMPLLTEVQANMVSLALITLRMKVTGNIRDNHANGDLKVTPTKLKFGAVPLRRDKPTIFLCWQVNMDALINKVCTDGMTQDSEVTAYDPDFAIACPLCKTLRICGNHQTTNKNKWKN